MFPPLFICLSILHARKDVGWVKLVSPVSLVEALIYDGGVAGEYGSRWLLILHSSGVFVLQEHAHREHCLFVSCFVVFAHGIHL